MSAILETSEGEKVLTCVNNEWKEEFSNITYNNGMLKTFCFDSQLVDCVVRYWHIILTTS